jgi:hypothetical protein
MKKLPILRNAALLSFAGPRPAVAYRQERNGSDRRNNLLAAVF